MVKEYQKENRIIWEGHHQGNLTSGQEWNWLGSQLEQRAGKGRGQAVWGCAGGTAEDVMPFPRGTLAPSLLKVSVISGRLSPYMLLKEPWGPKITWVFKTNCKGVFLKPNCQLFLTENAAHVSLKPFTFWYFLRTTRCWFQELSLPSQMAHLQHIPRARLSTSWKKRQNQTLTPESAPVGVLSPCPLPPVWCTTTQLLAMTLPLVFFWMSMFGKWNDHNHHFPLRAFPLRWTSSVCPTYPESKIKRAETAKV